VEIGSRDFAAFSVAALASPLAPGPTDRDSAAGRVPVPLAIEAAGHSRLFSFDADVPAAIRVRTIAGP